MPLSDFANANVDDVVEQLTTDEAILLTAGVGFWYTHGIERLGIPAIKTSDGPNGVRGGHFFMGSPAKCLPSATALGATFDTKLIEEIGYKLLAPEAKLKASSILLGPTCNMQRHPSGGRAFESFSEDPHLSGMIAASYVNGVQRGGVGATIKHFVTNDKELDRMGYDSIVSERALREIYLMPFMLAEKYAKPWAYMTAYNRLNGPHLSESPILKNTLRDEWGFKGMVMSDWFGVYGIDAAINAGLDLEMPGTNKWRTLDLMNRSIVARKITARTVKERARTVLELVQRACKEAPDVVNNGDREYSKDTDEEKALMRRLGAESIVLLKNEGGVLPIKPQEQGIKKIAIVGGNAKAFTLSGGGSAALKASYFVNPFEGIESALKHEQVEVTYCEGAPSYKELPSLDNELVTADGEKGWVGEWFSHTSDESMQPQDKPFKTQVIDETRAFIGTSYPDGLTNKWTLRLKCYLKPRETDETWAFGLIAAGRAKLWINGEQIIDNWTRQRRGEAFFNAGTEEERGTIKIKANTKAEIYVEFCNVRGPADGDENETIMDSNPGVKLGGSAVEDPDVLLEKAVELAKQADVVIAVVGLNADWESEGYDRKTLDLPGRTNELVSKVAQANKKTVVVTQSGSSIVYPWASEVASIIHAWYLGNATGHAIADVLFGAVNPSGKLSLSFPKRMEDLASHGHFHSENGKVLYAEDIFMGYKHYDNIQSRPAWDFGFGLSYTTFALSGLEIGASTRSEGDVKIPISFTLTNTGSVAGAQVAQVYTSLPTTSQLTHPVQQLKAFRKVLLQPGENQKISIELDKYAVSYWQDVIGRWVVEKGEYGITVGFTSGAGQDGERLNGTVSIDKVLEWNGL